MFKSKLIFKDLTNMTSLTEIEAAISQLPIEDIRQLADWIQNYLQKDGEEQSPRNSYSLRGTSVQYLDPFEPVAAEDWNTCS